MLKLLKIGAIGALTVAVLVWPALWAITGQAETFQAIEPSDAETVLTNQQLFELDPTDDAEEILAIYGSALGEPTRYLFVDEARVVRPQEKPELRLLQVYKSRDENPLQLQSVALFTRFTSVGAGVTALLLFGLYTFLRRRRGAGARAAVAAAG
ncbi:MAG: hypothetical protein QNJ90_10595 [Planctomycetota bacterium]|nr:hypothetical protein [Planctomycetota bacterium]